MKWLEIEGTTVDEAVSSALKKLNVKKEEIEVEIIDKGSRGFLGILGNRQAKIRVKIKSTPDKLVCGFLESLIKNMEMRASVKAIKKDEIWNILLTGPDVRFLIGKRGETLNAIQLMVNLVVRKNFTENVRVLIDADNYRLKREEALRRLARKLAERVRKTRKDIYLEPMTPQERRLIHLELQEDPLVYTESKGEEPNRKVVICLRR